MQNKVGKDTSLQYQRVIKTQELLPGKLEVREGLTEVSVQHQWNPQHENKSHLWLCEAGHS